MRNFSQVHEGAKRALTWVNDQFKYKTGIRAITSKGNTLDTIAFRSEEVDTSRLGSAPGVRCNNDDIILSSCLHLSTKASSSSGGGGWTASTSGKNNPAADNPDDPHAPLRLQRDAVLLTDDRNLRVKAHARNVPVKDILDFIRWAKIS